MPNVNVGLLSRPQIIFNNVRNKAGHSPWSYMYTYHATALFCRFGPCLNYIWCRNYKQNECRNDSIKLVMDNEDSHFLKMCL